MGKLRLREAKSFVPSHTDECLSGLIHQVCPSPQSKHFTALHAAIWVAVTFFLKEPSLFICEWLGGSGKRPGPTAGSQILVALHYILDDGQVTTSPCFLFPIGWRSFKFFLVSCSWCNEWPQTRWLKTIETYSVTVLEARSPKPRCLWGCAPSEGSRIKTGTGV